MIVYQLSVNNSDDETLKGSDHKKKKNQTFL